MEQIENVQFPETTDETEVPMVQMVQLTRWTPQLQCVDEVVRVPVAAQESEQLDKCQGWMIIRASGSEKKVRCT